MAGEIPLKYAGPPRQICYALSEEGYPAALVPGKIYSLSPDLAESLLNSSAHWKRIDGGVREVAGELVEYDLAPAHRRGETFSVASEVGATSTYSKTSVKSAVAGKP